MEDQQGVRGMLEIKGNGVRLTRGDSTRFTLRLEGLEVPNGTRALFTVKKRAWRYEAPVIEESFVALNNEVEVILSPEQTNISTGDYVWDLRLFIESEDGFDVMTPMTYAAFDVVEVIANE